VEDGKTLSTASCDDADEVWVVTFIPLTQGGMLALPGGLIAGAGSGYGPAFGLLVFSALSSAYTFILVGRSVEATNSGSFKQVG